MNQAAQPIEADAFLASLRDRTAHGISTIALDGGALPVSVDLRESSSLVFTFTGAAARNGRALPQFASIGLKDHVPASFIRLADPSLDRDDEMRLAWYAGHEGFELQKILPDLLRRMIDSLGATRVAFVGASGGGFSALYYSLQIPGSVAIALNPQTDLNRYHGGHRKRYRAVCWPSLNEDAPLDAVIDADLAPLYARQLTNTVICLQIASDFFHLTRQFAPFIAALPLDYLDRLIVRVANWGIEGHKSPPTNIWIPWVTAVLSAPETSAASIEETWAEQNPLQLPRLKRLTHHAEMDALVAAAIGNTGTNELPDRLPRQEPFIRPANRDEMIAAELARTAANALLGTPSSERSQL